MFSELKRRNVFRMAVLYVAAAWLVVQVVGALIDLRVLPGELGPWIMVALAIGFPIALVVSWFFDITPEGVVRETDLPEGQPDIGAAGRRTDFIIIAILSAAIVLMLVWEPPVSADDALTVLASESMASPEEAAFSEGVSIELLNLLAQLRKLKVKHPPEATIRAHFSDLPTLAKEMDVRWVLKLSVRRAESRVRIAAQLIDVDDDASIAWSNVFDRQLSATNIFGIQTEIARSITSELRLSLDEPAEQRLTAPPTQNTEAYNAYLVGRQRLTDLRVDWLKDAVEHFARAIEFDPAFGEAHSGLVDACFAYVRFGSGKNHEQCPADDSGLLVLARKAVQLAPESGEAWISLGMMIDIVKLWSPVEKLNWDFGKVRPLVSSDSFKALTAEADGAYRRGLELNPGYSRGYQKYAWFLFRKHMWNQTWLEGWKNDVWSKVVAQGLEVDPLSIRLHYLTHYPDWVKTREQSLWHARRIIEIAPDSPRGYLRLGQELWQNFGRADEMVRLATKAAVLDPKHVGYPWHIAHAYMALGDYDMALAYFRLAESLSEGDSDNEDVKALALLYAGRTEEAINLLESLQDSKAIYPNIPLNILAGMDLRAGQTENAMSRYRQHEPECFVVPKSYDVESRCPIFGFMRVAQAVGDEESLHRMLTWEEEHYKKLSGWKERAKEMEYYPWILYSVRLDAIAGRHEQALTALEDVVEKGFRGSADPRLNWRFFAYNDISVDSIRDHPRFRAAIATIEADMAQQLENVREMQRRGDVPTLEDVNELIASAQDGG